MPVIPASSIFGDQDEQVKVTYQKPKHLQQIQSTATIIDSEYQEILDLMPPVKQTAKLEVIKVPDVPMTTAEPKRAKVEDKPV